MTMLTASVEAEIIATANELNTKYDKLNAIIEDFEQFLENTGVGVCTWIEQPLFTDGPHAFVSTSWQLGYIRYEDKWRIVVRPWDASTPEKPLVNASRATRIEAISQFETLAITITSRMRHYIDSINNLYRLTQEKSCKT